MIEVNSQKPFLIAKLARDHRAVRPSNGQRGVANVGPLCKEVSGRILLTRRIVGHANQNNCITDTLHGMVANMCQITILIEAIRLVALKCFQKYDYSTTKDQHVTQHLVCTVLMHILLSDLLKAVTELSLQQIIYRIAQVKVGAFRALVTEPRKVRQKTSVA